MGSFEYQGDQSEEYLHFIEETDSVHGPGKTIVETLSAALQLELEKLYGSS